MKLELKDIVDAFKYQDTIIGASDVWKIVAISDARITLYNGKSYNDMSIEDFEIDYRIEKHPLSDLTKEIEVNGVKFVPKDWLNVNLHNTPNFHHLSSEPHIWKYYQNNILKSNVEYCIIEKLYEWHFDIHGLIEQGLAIDINTLDL